MHGDNNDHFRSVALATNKGWHKVKLETDVSNNIYQILEKGPTNEIFQLWDTFFTLRTPERISLGGWYLEKQTNVHIEWSQKQEWICVWMIGFHIFQHLF